MDNQNKNSRREFVKTSALLTGGVMSMPLLSKANFFSGADDTIKVALVGCGGRGTGAAMQACLTKQNVKLVAMADAFRDRIDSCYKSLTVDDITEGSGTPKNIKNRIDVPEERKYTGFDAYKKAMAHADVVILTTPPGFRPIHFEEAVSQSKQIFMEKPVATDPAGIKKVLDAAVIAKQKKLNVVVGLQRHYQNSYRALYAKKDLIGDITSAQAWWNNDGVWVRERKYNQTEMEYQMRNWYYFVWLCGDHITEQHVHNLDVCNWIMNAHPVKCWGMGARQQLGDKSGEIWDNFGVEYEYANGVRLYSYCGQIKRDWASVSEAVHGTKGWSDPSSRIVPKDGQPWRFRDNNPDPYVQEHVHLIQAIVNGTELNEAKQVTDSTMTAILGREAAYSGAGAEWDQVLNSKFSYGPELVYEDSSKMKFGPYRVLVPPMPSSFTTLKDPAVAPVRST
jgi:predicted dehydrogenase